MLAQKVDGGGSGGVLNADDGGVAKHAERVGSQTVAQLLIELHVTNPREHLRHRHELDSFGRVVVFDACYYLLFRFRRQVGEIGGGKCCCSDAADNNERYSCV